MRLLFRRAARRPPSNSRRYRACGTGRGRRGERANRARRNRLIPLDDGIAVAIAELVHRPVLAAARDHRLEVHGLGRANGPLLDDRVLARDLCPEKGDGADILQRLRLDDRRREAVARVFLDDQRTVRHRNRAEEAGLRIADRLELAGRELEAEDVGNAGVIGAAVQVPAIAREYEALGDGLAEIGPGKGLHLAGLEVCPAKHVQELLAVDRPDRHGQHGAVSRHVEFEGHVAIGPGIDLVPVGVGERDAHQGHVTVEVRSPHSERSDSSKQMSPMRASLSSMRA